MRHDDPRTTQPLSPIGDYRDPATEPLAYLAKLTAPNTSYVTFWA